LCPIESQRIEESPRRLHFEDRQQQGYRPGHDFAT
jgi:hypothetical protein